MNADVTELWAHIRNLEQDLDRAKRDIRSLEVALDRKADEFHDH